MLKRSGWMWMGRAIALAMAGLSLGTAAEGFVVIEDQPRPERRVAVPVAPDRGRYLDLKQQEVWIGIENAVARVKSEEVFHNPTGSRIEGTYLFPVPAESGIKDFTMEINGREVKGELLDRDEARGIYEKIVRSLRDPALLEYAGHGLVRASIFPIEPHADVKVTLSYVAPVDKTGGMDRFVFPLSACDAGSKPVGKVSLKTELKSNAAVRTVYVPEYDVKVDRPSDQTAKISLDLENARVTRDFSVYFSADEGKDIRADLLVHRADAEYGMLALSIPESRRVEPKDVAIVLDVSGSMSGDKLASAKNAIRFILEHLNPSDRFTLIPFSGMARPVWEGLKKADASAVTEAKNFLDETEAEGGTNLHEGLQIAREALSNKSNRPGFVLLVTDGKPTVGPKDQPAFESLTDGGPFVFTVGIGVDVNAVLLDVLTRRTRAQGILLEEKEDIEVKISDLYRSFSAPLLHEVTLEWKGVEMEDIYPRVPKVLFSGSRALLFGRLKRGTGPVSVVVRGLEGDEEVRSYIRIPEKALENRRDNDFIPTLWARKKVAHLIEQIRHEGEDSKLVEEIKTLGTRHGIVTPYTSFLVKEPEGLAFSERAREPRRPASAVVRKERAVAGDMTLPAPSVPQAKPTRKAELAGAYSRTDGVAAFEASRALKQAKATESLDEMERNESEEIRRAGDKTFILKDGVWTDAALIGRPGVKPIQTIVFGSDAYYDLIFSDAILAKYLSVGENVLMEHNGRILRIMPEPERNPAPAAPAGEP
ncbi:VWA domain-containing protein [bacterium]|nr:VWA domain-containing protein [bacterium]